MKKPPLIFYRSHDWLNLESLLVLYGIQARSRDLFNDSDWHHCICGPGNIIFFRTESARDNHLKKLRRETRER